jgi:hypothetical protein
MLRNSKGRLAGWAAIGVAGGLILGGTAWAHDGHPDGEVSPRGTEIPGLQRDAYPLASPEGIVRNAAGQVALLDLDAAADVVAKAVGPDKAAEDGAVATVAYWQYLPQLERAGAVRYVDARSDELRQFCVQTHLDECVIE